MKQPVGRIAVEGKHIVRDFRLGTATTTVDEQLVINHSKSF